MIERAISDLFHDALDHEDVSGPFQRLQLELEKPGAAHRRAGRRIFMTRNRLVLLAAALVLILGISVVVSARVLNGAKVGQSINAGPKTTVAQLLARPLVLKHHQPGDQCTDGPMTNGLYGAGPVYGNGVGPTSTAWGSYWDIYFVTPVDQAGPIVTRGMDLKNDSPIVYLGKYGVGPRYGTDVYNGKTYAQYTAIAFDPDHPPGPAVTMNNPAGSFYKWQLTDGIKAGWTGCFGYQVDGPDFEETFFSTD